MSLCRRTSIFSEEGATWHVEGNIGHMFFWSMPMSDVGRQRYVFSDVDIGHRTSDIRHQMLTLCKFPYSFSFDKHYRE